MLSFACERGLKVIVETLIKKGVDPNTKNSLGRSALSYACEKVCAVVGWLTQYRVVRCEVQALVEVRHIHMVRMLFAQLSCNFLIRLAYWGLFDLRVQHR